MGRLQNIYFIYMMLRFVALSLFLTFLVHVSSGARFTGDALRDFTQDNSIDPVTGRSQNFGKFVKQFFFSFCLKKLKQKKKKKKKKKKTFFIIFLMILNHFFTFLIMNDFIFLI